MARQHAAQAVAQAAIPALAREIEHAARVLTAPAARLLSTGGVQLVDLSTVERTLASPALVDEPRQRKDPNPDSAEV